MQRIKQRFLLISIVPQKLSDLEAFRDLKELKDLVDTYGGEVVEWVIQNREVHDKGSYIGAGKVREALDVIKEKEINIVVLNAIIKPGQLYDLKKIFYKGNPTIEVWDRVDLILHIFSKHAKTTEARLQIELAAMHHMGPRIYGMGMEMSRQTGGIGGRGIGETNTERMKRHWREQMKKVKDKLEKLSQDRERQMERRRRVGLKTVSIVGYTNAGKSSLFNALTSKKKLVENALFATLDSAVGKLVLPEGEDDILLSDTIGFIKNLPTDLIEAFKSTLMESIHADLLLHVIDISDERMEEKIRVVRDIVFDLGLGKKEQIYVFNKIDAVEQLENDHIVDRYESFTPQFISVKTGLGIGELTTVIQEKLETK
jgi:GTPase